MVHEYGNVWKKQNVLQRLDAGLRFFQHYIYIFGHCSWAQNVHNRLLVLIIQLLPFV